MSSNFYNVGLNHVGAYQVSGVPFLTGSTDTLAAAGDEVRFQFPNVTKSITLKNNSNDPLNIHFAPWAPGSFGYTYGASTNDNYLVLDSQHEITVNVKCREIFASATKTNQALKLEVRVELTNIPASRMFSLDGLDGVAQ